LSIITNINFDTKFIFSINNIDFYIEGEIDSFLFNIENKSNNNILNSLSLDITYIPFYKNIFFIKTYNEENYNMIFNMIFLTNLIPVTSDYTDYNNLLLGNDFFFKSYSQFSSAKLINENDFNAANKFTQHLFRNIYYTETIEQDNAGVVNVYSLINGQPFIVQKYPFLNIKEKFKIAVALEHSCNIHNIKEYLDNEYLFIEHDYTHTEYQLDDIDLENE
jgi:hypothetical protein